MTEQYQLFPPLAADQYAALKEDIQQHGILIPIEVDEETGELLDGHHRLQIANELGLDVPTQRRHFESDEDRLAHVIALNLKRRHLDAVTWGEFFIRYAEARGARLGRGAGDPSGKSDTVSLLAGELGVNVRTAQRRVEAARLPEALREQVRTGERTVRTALQEHKRSGRIEAAVVRETDGSRELGVEQSVYQTIVVDPPWAYERDDIRGAAEQHYDTMSFDEIAAYPVAALAADDAHLYLWVTNPHLPYVWRIVEAWGFEYKTMLTWVKPQMGTGHYFRGATEHVLFCTKGSLPLRDAGIRNWFEAPRTEHSAKPDVFYELVERASFGPYVELFGRRAREGWRVMGDEAPK